MSLTAHLQELKKKHQKLSEQIEDLEKDTAFDQAPVSELKKHRLKMKERITELEKEIPTAIAAE